MSIDGQSDVDIRAILETTRRIALVGASAKPWRPSHGVMRFLLDHGHEVTPVNPGLAGQAIHDRQVVGRLDAARRSRWWTFSANRRMSAAWWTTRSGSAPGRSGCNSG